MTVGKPTSPDAPALEATARRGVFWRLLSLQASWNDQRMQNLGLLACLAPWLNRQELSSQQVRSCCRRYFGYFNTNPYLAGFVVGGLLHLEHARAAGRPVSERDVSGFRDTLARVCGALGDQILWLGLRPGVMLLACGLAALGRWQLVLALVALVTLAQLWLRWRSLAMGFRLGADVVDVLNRPLWRHAVVWSRRVGLSLTGLLIGVYFASGFGLGETVGTGRFLGLTLLGFALPALVRQKTSAEAQLLLSLPIVWLLVAATA
ncbi:MAG: PTS system mannose/fructose/sorbose family transporter subunit IID [Candidatus Krumholzibacteria bacterium]|jgi:PTS system mannose-specific IID component|nr:PTS system mannose/fructose/sorbose family transporter subunit IID [Candidatus Krumholzibacteria bacterium]